uniref:Uncharacterized protein n=1 Tax=Davidia involucrata TaxID=16924 RepID=A0A5B7BNR9_DAVIN
MQFYHYQITSNRVPCIHQFVKTLTYIPPICEDFDLYPNEFVEMMLLDGCFILERFKGADEGFTKLGYSPSDPIFEMHGSIHSIRRDMMMLENQIPLFILDRLLELQLDNLDHQTDQKGRVAELALQFFEPLTPTVTDESLHGYATFIALMSFDEVSCAQGLNLYPRFL